MPSVISSSDEYGQCRATRILPAFRPDVGPVGDLPPENDMLRVGLVLHEAAHWLRWEATAERHRVERKTRMSDEELCRIYFNNDGHGPGFVAVLDCLVADWSTTDQESQLSNGSHRFGESHLTCGGSSAAGGPAVGCAPA